jgi:hypothetical protein
MKYLKLTVFLICFCFAAGICYADDVSISANADKQEVTLDDQVTLTITVSGNVSNIPQPEIPDLKGFTSYSSGRSQNLSIINGKVSSSVVFTYILVPGNTGDYSLGPFSINYQGKTYSTDPINIKVLPRSAQSSGPEEQNVQQQPQHGKEIFIEAYVDKLTAYVNEQITLTFAVYQAVNLLDNPTYNPPVTTGFWAEDMPPQRKYYKVINGTRYLVTEIKTALFATGPGEFAVGSARLEATVEDMNRVLQDPFGMFKSGKPVILATEPIKIEIVPLPEQNKPSDFKGDVGDFDVSMSVDKTAVEENQPVSLKIKIKGKGNIKTISSPALPDVQDVKSYESGSSENISKDNYVVHGEKIFDKMFIPKKEGSVVLGPLDYVYFNPAIKDYVRKKLDPVTISVAKSKEEPQQQAVLAASPEKEEIRLLKKDIAYIKILPPRLKSKGHFLYKNKAFISANIFPLLILVILYVYALYRNRLKTDIKYARSLRAKSAAAKRLKWARKTISKNMVKEFYTEIYKAVIEYVADKLNIPHPSITKDLLEDKLKSAGAGEDVINKVKALFDDCDMARFASAKFTKLDMDRTIKEAEDIIMNLEKHI